MQKAELSRTHDSTEGSEGSGWGKHPDQFSRRHIGPSQEETAEMLAFLGFKTLDELVSSTVPSQIRTSRPLDLPAARSEFELLRDLRRIASANKPFRSFIGAGYSDCITPPVIQRNILENPGWYTQYTPYQAEIAQGRLEALLNFQTMIIELTGMEIANASLLDEGTAAAEGMALSLNARTGTGSRFFVSELCHPQTIAIVQTRAKPLGVEVVIGDHLKADLTTGFFGALVQYPATDGQIFDYREFIENAHAHNVLVTVAADLLALTLFTPPGEFGADIVVGNSQRFGVPLGYGGPHAAYFATRDRFRRQVPGRLVGVSKDAAGRPAYRLSLQTREQHIRREKATSNICTAQVLLAVISSMYAVYHGPQGLRRIAQYVRSLTCALKAGLEQLGYSTAPAVFFDTLTVKVSAADANRIINRAEKNFVNLRRVNEETLGISLDEATTLDELDMLLRVFAQDESGSPLKDLKVEDQPIEKHLQRTSPFLQHSVFNRYHSETEMLRYLRRLESRDLSLTSSMIPLGSCTMKLNATSEMIPVTWPEFSRIHPFAPLEQTRGYQELFRDLERWLGEITGLPSVSLQPNAGSQGEYAGLLAIREFHESNGQSHRAVCLIPQSAHGTNPASAVMAGLRVVPVACDKDGNIDVSDLEAKAEQHKSDLAALMVTYPSTHGVFEERIQQICEIVHRCGGQVYMDGANLNAQVGLCRPGELGADVCHINLHKTFCIPHGGGGPGMGPICVAPHLAAFLPSHPVISTGREVLGPISAAPWGSASILVISWVYIALMGGKGLTEATKIAILNANYIARRLDPYFPVLFKGAKGFVAHECIVDLRHFKSVSVEDVAKRLMDYSFHAPTISWPVPGTVMIEPTESESKEELDRFCEALIGIHGEIEKVERGEMDSQMNPLKQAPHTAEAVTADVWERPYSRQKAAYPADWLRSQKFWPAVARIDNVYGDRHLVCSCAGMEAFASPPTATPGAQ